MSECAAIIVTYNRPQLAVRCLKDVVHQSRPPEHLILIDNASSYNLLEVIEKDGLIREELGHSWLWEHDMPWLPQVRCRRFKTLHDITLHFLRISKNIGGAGGFAAGISFACECLDSRWLWLLDDDAFPEKDALHRLLEFEKIHRCAALSPLKLSTDRKILYSHFGLLQFSWPFPTPLRKIPLDKAQEAVRIDASSFVGLLVNRGAVEKVGVPRADFFLHHDDIEYCIRLKEAGEIWLVPGSRVVHLEEARKRNRLSRPSILCLDYDKAWLSYYGKRNMMWLAWRNRKGLIGFGLSLAVTALAYVAVIILFADKRLLRMKMLFHAFLDGLKGRFLNDRPFEILYDRKRI